MADGLLFRLPWGTGNHLYGPRGRPVVAEGTHQALLRAGILRPEEQVPKAGRGGTVGLGMSPYSGADGRVTSITGGLLRVYAGDRGPWRSAAMARADHAFQAFLRRLQL